MYVSLKDNVYLYKNEVEPHARYFDEEPPFSIIETRKFNKSALYILERCDGTKTKEEIISSIVEDFDITRERAKKDVEKFLAEDDIWIEYLEEPRDEDDNIIKEKNIIGNFKGYRPTTAYLQLTFRCNMGCEYCYVPEDESKEDLGQVKDLIDRLYDVGVRRICLTGGEPFIRDDIISILEYSIEKFVSVMVQTNGSLILNHKEEILDLPKEPVTYIVSLDGPKDYMNSEYNGEYYDEIIGAVEELRANGNFVGFNSTMSSENIQYVDCLREKTEELLGPGVEPNWGMVMPIGNDLDRYEGLYQDNSFIEEYDEKIGKNYFGEFSEKHDVPRCSAGAESITVKPNGDIIPCVVLIQNEEYTLGNIFEDDLEDIIENHTKIFAQREKLSEEECSDCRFYTVCDGGYCLALKESICPENKNLI